MKSMIVVYRYRVKSLTGLLNQQARAVNFVWNYCNDRQKDALRFHRPWLTGFDLHKLTTGSSKELGLHSGTVNAVCEQYAKSRPQKRRPYLRYRGRRTREDFGLECRRSRCGNRRVLSRFCGRTGGGRNCFGRHFCSLS